MLLRPEECAPGVLALLLVGLACSERALQGEAPDAGGGDTTVEASPPVSSPAAPPVTAERLRAIKGPALYRWIGEHAPRAGDVIEVELGSGAGDLALVTVAQVDPERVRLAVVRKAADGSLPELRPDGEFAPEAEVSWVTRESFFFGGAAWDGTRRHVVWADLRLGGRLAVSSDGLREKVAFRGVTLKAARLLASGRWSEPVAIGVSTFGGAPDRGAFMALEDVALWPEQLAVEGGVWSLSLVVDSLIAPEYQGDDRPESDGRYLVRFELGTRGLRKRPGVRRLGPYAPIGFSDMVPGMERPLVETSEEIDR